MKNNQFEFKSYVNQKNNFNVVLLIAAVIFVIVIIYLTINKKKESDTILNLTEKNNDTIVNSYTNNYTSKNGNKLLIHNDQQDTSQIESIPQLIKDINDRVHAAFDTKSTITLQSEGAYVEAIKDSNGELEFYVELSHDSEGWPMEGAVYYFKRNKLIGYAYIICSGCIDKDITTKLKSLETKEYTTAEDLKDFDVIWCIYKTDKILFDKSSEILNKFH